MTDSSPLLAEQTAHGAVSPFPERSTAGETTTPAVTGRLVLALPLPLNSLMQ